MKEFINAFVEKAVYALSLQHNYKGAGLVLFDYDTENFCNIGVLPQESRTDVALHTAKVADYIATRNSEEEKYEAMKLAYVQLAAYVSTDEFSNRGVHKRVFYLLDKADSSIRGLITHEQFDYNFSKIEDYLISANLDNLKDVKVYMKK